MTVRQTAPERLETVAGAQQRLLDLVAPLPPEPVELWSALGRVLAAPVSARWDLPGFDNSAMDGYAVRARDLARAATLEPVRLPVRGEAAAGAPPGQLVPETAMRILTGAALPEGADAVVRQEDTERHGDSVVVQVAVRVGTNVRRCGEDVTAGTVVLHGGRRLTAADIAVAAASGHASLSVGTRPRVALLATGDELRPAGEPLAPAEVADSNSPMLAAAVHEAGGEPVFIGIVADTMDAVRAALRRAAEYDLIVSSAGVSVGDHDHVQAVLAELGEIALWRVAMRPGKPLLIGRVADTPFIGLPGNPVSSSVTFELFARPAILQMQGASDPHRRRVRVRLGEDVSKPAQLETFARARLCAADGDVPVATGSGGQGSHMLSGLVAADVLLVLPAGRDVVPAGTIVEAIPLR